MFWVLGGVVAARVVIVVVVVVVVVVVKHESCKCLGWLLPGLCLLVVQEEYWKCLLSDAGWLVL